MVRRLASAYFAGAAAALAASLVLWVAARADLLDALGVSLQASLDWPILAQEILWGSLWALGLPLLRRRMPGLNRPALTLALAPALSDLFVFLPEANHQMLGVGLGPLTPVVVLAQWALWGWVLARVVSRVEGKPS
jgi:hypothetical protein